MSDGVSFKCVSFRVSFIVWLVVRIELGLVNRRESGECGEFVCWVGCIDIGDMGILKGGVVWDVVVGFVWVAAVG